MSRKARRISLQIMEVYLVATYWFIAFAVFHSFCAHEIFKTFLTRVFGDFFVEHYWRLLYCIISYWMLYYGCLTDLLKYEDYVLMTEYSPVTWTVMAVIKISGLIIAYWAYVQFDYFEFWGIRQALRGIKHWRTKEPWKPMKLAGVQRLEVRGIYHFCRHPMLTGGLLVAIASVPIRTTFIYAAMYFVYMIIGAYFEEKRLITHFGEQYLQYRKDVGTFLPSLHQLRRKKQTASSAVTE